jgi:cellulose synthase/poly-beta-1,6-N-acetylglucosamine synthase-like glycosyltransferase
MNNIKEPTIDIIIPTLGRPEGLERLKKSIENLDYPKDKINVCIIDDELRREGVPKALKRGVEATKGDYIVYAANDTEFDSQCLKQAIIDASETGFCALNTGKILQDEGNICEHFIIKRDLIKDLDGEIFDTEFYHVAVDNILWLKLKKLGKARRSYGAILHHYHFSKGYEFDDIYKIAWNEDRVKHDRDLLQKKIIELGLN